MMYWPCAAWRSSQPQQQAPLGPSFVCARCLGCWPYGQGLLFGSAPSLGLILRLPPSLPILDSFKFTERSCSPNSLTLTQVASRAPRPLHPELLLAPKAAGTSSRVFYSTEISLSLPPSPTVHLTSSQSPLLPDSPQSQDTVFTDYALRH